MNFIEQFNFANRSKKEVRTEKGSSKMTDRIFRRVERLKKLKRNQEYFYRTNK